MAPSCLLQGKLAALGSEQVKYNFNDDSCIRTYLFKVLYDFGLVHNFCELMVFNWSVIARLGTKVVRYSLLVDKYNPYIRD